MVNYVSDTAATVAQMPYFSSVEALDAKAIAQLQQVRLQAQYQYLWAQSAFYQRKFREAGLTPHSVQSLDDLSRVPFTVKQELRDSLNAASDSQHYGAPLLFQLDRFDEVRATVLQATRSPGKPIVYLGSLLLVLGVFAMLYIRERRLFVLVKHSGEALVALSSNRKSLDVDTAFAAHRDALATRFTPPADAPPAIEPR